MTKIKYLTAEVDASATSYTFTDSSIGDNSSIKIVTNPSNKKITGATQVGTSCTVTFDAGEAFSIRAEVSNIEEFKVDADGDSDDAMPATEEFASDADLEALANIVDERVPDETVLGGYLYHGTTGNSWKKPDASTLNYDENSTIYSVIGDIDDLETVATNLVDAINEASESGGGGGLNLPIDDTPVKVGKIGDKDLYCIRILRENPPHNTWGVIGSVPANTTIIRISGSFGGSYSGQRIVGFLSDAYGESAWKTYTQILGNSLQVNTGTSVQKLDIFIEFYYNE